MEMALQVHHCDEAIHGTSASFAAGPPSLSIISIVRQRVELKSIPYNSWYGSIPTKMGKRIRVPCAAATPREHGGFTGRTYWLHRAEESQCSHIIGLATAGSPFHQTFTFSSPDSQKNNNRTSPRRYPTRGVKEQNRVVSKLTLYISKLYPQLHLNPKFQP